MQLPAIKKAVENFSIEQLQKSELLLMDGNAIEIEIIGEDEGEQLTHILSAIWIKTEMAEKNTDYNSAFRAYMSKVRNSIN